MTTSRTRRAGLLVLGVIVACLLGQMAAISPAQAEDPAAPAALQREPVTLTRGERPAVTGGIKPTEPLEMPPGPDAADVPTAPSRDRAWNLLMTEDFEGAFPSAGWTVFDDDGATNGEYFWDDDDYMAHNGSWSAWPARGGANGQDPSLLYPLNANSWMVYGPFDLSGYAAAEVEFFFWNQTEPSWDWFNWMASTDGVNFSGWRVSGDSGGWAYEVFDLATWVGEPTVYLAFVFDSDESYNYLGTFVDDIDLWADDVGGAGPVNDDFDSPITVGSAPYTNTQDITGATTAGDDPGFPCSSNSPKSRTVWYRYTAPSAETLTIDTFGSSYDTVLGVWTGSRGSLTNVACNDDSGMGLQSRVDFAATAGTTYHIEVADYGSLLGTSLTLNLAASGVVGDTWTYMVYLDGDNNLEAAAIDDFLELSSVGSSANVDIVALFDRAPGYSTAYDNWTDARLFYITTGMTPTAANGVNVGEVNMGDPATLVNFVQWAQANYPADRYALILWDHGSGWRQRPLDEPGVQGIAYDETSGNDGLNMTELRAALNALTAGGTTPIDLIGMDACLMAMIEVANQLRPYAGVLVTSQETEPNDGAPQDAIVGALVANPAMSTAALATIYVDQYYASYGNDEVQSAVDLGSDYNALNAAVDNFAAALIVNGAAHAAGIQAARNAVQEFFYDYYIDLWDFADRVQANVGDATIDTAAQAVKDAVDTAVIHEQSGAAWPGAHGVSIYFPKTAGEYDARYDGTSGFLQFTAGTQWDEWIHAYHALPTGTPWSFLSPMSVARDRVAVAATGGKVYAIGGESTRTAGLRIELPTGDRTPLGEYSPSRAWEAEVEEYNPGVGTWTARAPKPTGVSNAGAGVINGVIYLPGGYNGTTEVNVLEAYNPATNTWSVLAPMPALVSGGAVAAVGSKLYVMGGYTVAGDMRDTCYVYDQPTNTWSTCASMTVPRGWAAAAVVDGKVYVAGGIEQYTYNDLVSVERYDPATNTWTWMPVMSTGRGGAAAVGYGGGVYVCGGGFFGPYLATCETFNPATNTWSPFDAMNVGRTRLGLVETGSVLYAVGGWDDGGFLGTNESHAVAAPAPGAFGKTAPANAATGIALGPTLSWGASSGATSYEYCYDTSSNGTCDTTWASAGTATSAPLAGLAAGTTYSWQVRAQNGAGTTYADGGVWWTFTTGTAPGGFAKTTPGNTVSNVALNPTLSWTAATGVTSYEYCIDTSNNGACDGSWVSTGTGTSVGLTGLAPGTTHYWQVRAMNAFGTTYANGGTWWSFTTGSTPAAFGKATPVNGASGQSLATVLDWGISTGVTSYEYCIDTSNNGACDGSWVSTGTGTSVGLTGLAPGTTHYWQVRANNTFGTTYADGGTWWSFTTGSAPAAFGKATPVNGATGQSLATVLDWGSSTGVISYEYCIDTTDNAACDTGWVNVGGASAASPPGLAAGTTYFWQARANNAFGTTYANGLTTNYWHFTTAGAPSAFAKVSPANGATDQARDPWLVWGAALDATLYEYCYDTTNNGACDGSWVDMGGSTGAHLSGLAYDTTYYWQARALNAHGTTYADGGAWWSFTTVGPTMLQMTFRSSAAEDGWVLETGEDTTKGSDTLDATSTTSRLGDDDQDRQYRSILHFDTSALPDNAVITGITIRIKKDGFTGTNPFTFFNPNQKKGLNLLKVDMQAGYYHDIPTLEKYDFHAVGSRGNVGRFIKTPDAGWYRAPLRAASYPLLNLSGVTQFRLRFDLDDNDDMAPDYLRFYTGNAPLADRPELIVDYYLP